jgi:hypothetical protein
MSKRSKAAKARRKELKAILVEEGAGKREVTEVMEVTEPRNEQPPLSADEANERVQKLIDEGMREDFAVAEVMKKLKGEEQ